MYSAQEIAAWFIYKLQPEPLKLQKLLYLAQGYSYAFFDQPLFKEDMEAWVHGPVVVSVYHEYQEYKYHAIKKKAPYLLLDSKALEVLNFVCDQYANYSSKSLEELTHAQEPWLIARQGLSSFEPGYEIIKKENIAQYFISELFQPDDEEWDL